MKIGRIVTTGDAIDRLDGIMILMGIDGSILDANIAALDFYGYPYDQMIRLNVRDLRAPEDHASIEGHIRNAAERGATYEATERHRDGTASSVEVRSIPVVVDNEAALLNIVQDVTERRRFEEALRVQHQLSLRLGSGGGVHEALEQILDAALTMEGIDAGGVYLADDDGALELVVHQGLSEEFVANAARYPADAPQSRLARNGRTVRGSYAGIRPESSSAVHSEESLLGLVVMPVAHRGQLLAVLNLASHSHHEIPIDACNALETMAQQVGGIVMRMHADEALRESQRDLKALFDAVDDFLFVLDETGSIILTNATVTERLGYRAEELAGQDVLLVHPPERRAEAAQIIGAMLAGERDHCPVDLQTKDGTLIPVETRVSAGTWGGRPALFGLSREVTPRDRVPPGE